jgi:hypothetical protein
MKNVFGYVEIIKRAPDYVSPTNYRQTRWYALDKFGVVRSVQATCLFSGQSAGRQAKDKSGSGSVDKSGKIKNEYATVRGHWRVRFNPNNKQHVSYKHMRLCDEWNPNKGGSFIAGTLWIENNLPCPGQGYELHVIKSTKYSHGYFGPGGIVWRHKMDRHDQYVLDLVCEWSDKTFDDFVKQEYRRRNRENQDFRKAA